MASADLPLVSLIFPVKNEGVNVTTTIASALKVKSQFPFEMIVVDDGSSDHCCDFIEHLDNTDSIKLMRTDGIGLAKAKNLGAEHSKGEYLIFCDAHLFFENFWMERLLEPIRSGKADGTTPGIASTHSPKLPGYGQTLNQNLSVQWKALAVFGPIAVLPGGCFAVSREVFFDVGGFDHEFKVWGYEDVEISMKMWLLGYQCYVQPQVKILHLFRNAHPYQVSFDHVYYNMLRMAYSHFNEARIEKCKKLIIHSNPKQIEASVLEEGVVAQREAYFKRRKHDDEWYIRKFGIPF